MNTCGIIPLLAGIAVLAVRPASAPTTRSTTSPSAPDSACTAELLKRTPRYEISQVGKLVGRYRWYTVDTLSTRAPIPARYRKPGKVVNHEFRLWVTDSALRHEVRGGAGHGYRPAIGPLSGELVGSDTVGFSPEHPQVEVEGTNAHYLAILYDARVGRGLMDGGHVMEFLPIEVLGGWGFGGYYDTAGDLIGVLDTKGKVVPSIAGFYCAFRVGT